VVVVGPPDSASHHPGSRGWRGRCSVLASVSRPTPRSRRRWSWLLRPRCSWRPMRSRSGRAGPPPGCTLPRYCGRV